VELLQTISQPRAKWSVDVAVSVAKITSFHPFYLAKCIQNYADIHTKILIEYIITWARLNKFSIMKTGQTRHLFHWAFGNPLANLLR